MQGVEHYVKFADGSIQHCLGTVRIPVAIGKERYTVDFVVGQFSDKAILGMTELQSLGLTLDFRSLKLKQGDVDIPVVDCYHNSLSRRIITKEPIILPPRQESWVEGQVVSRGKSDIVSSESYITEPVQSMVEKIGVLVARVVHNEPRGKIPVLIYNPQEEPVLVEARTAIGLLVKVEHVRESQVAANNQVSVRKMEVSTNVKLPEYLKDVFERGRIHLTDQESQKLRSFLSEYQDVFSKNDEDIGCTDYIEHSIDTGDAKPIKVPPRRLGQEQRKAADELISGLLRRKLIEPSNSAWAAPIVMVKKKDGSFRLCLDYRVTVNKVSKLDGYPIPRIDSSLDCLANAKFYCSTDLSSGYWQVPMAPDSKEKTAFCHQNGPSGGLYHWNVLPFGLNTAPGTFQRLMDSMLADLMYVSLLIYLDDILIYGSSFEQTLERLAQYLERLRKANLKLKPGKCELFQKSVSFLGHIVSENGVSTDPKKIEAVKEWPQPRTSKQVKAFLGLASYYRRFIPEFSTIAKPLTMLTSVKNKFKWTPECDLSFQELKDRLVCSPILGYPQEKGTFIVDTDASNVGLGGILSQVQTEGDTEVERVLAYGSRTLSAQEVNYCVTRRELLAIVHHLKLWKCYLLGRRFIVRTDHSSLKYLHRFREPEGQLARWLDFLQPFDFEIIHRPGVSHGNADGLSRVESESCKKKSCYCKKLQDLSYDPPVVIETGTDKVDAAVQVDCTEVCRQVRAVKDEFEWSNEALVEAQMVDPEVGPVFNLISKNLQFTWDNFSNASGSTKQLLMDRNCLSIRSGLLYRKWEDRAGRGFWYQLVLPSKYRQEVMTYLHDSAPAGHLGGKKTYHRVRARFYWPGMRQFIQRWVLTCEVCQQRKGPPKKPKGKMQEYLVGAPNERVGVDIMGPYSVSDNNNQWLLVIGDLFTRYCVAVPLPDFTATTVAETIVMNWVALFGVPLELHTDRATYFEGNTFRGVCQLLGIQKTRTTAFRPQSDGFIERANQTINNILNCVIQDNPFSWDRLVKLCTLAYNSSVQESTGETPAVMMFGRELRLPLDIMIPVPDQQGKCNNPPEYVLELQSRLEKVYENARLNSKKACIRQQHNYNNRLKENHFHPGSVVYYLNPVKGKSPKESFLKWTGPYVVTKKLSEAVYQIRLNQSSNPITVNHDRLKPALLRAPKDTSWVNNCPNREKELSITEAEESNVEYTTGSSRPSQSKKSPDRLGDWQYNF